VKPRWAIWREIWKLSCLPSLYTVSVEKLWTQNTRIIHDVWRLLILSNDEKRKVNSYTWVQCFKVHVKFCKLLLNLKTSTPNFMLYGELGRYLLNITVKLKILLFWSKLIDGKQSKLSSLMWLHWLIMIGSLYMITVNKYFMTQN
jgi:hypothetical protein